MASLAAVFALDAGAAADSVAGFPSWAGFDPQLARIEQVIRRLKPKAWLILAEYLVDIYVLQR